MKKLIFIFLLSALSGNGLKAQATDPFLGQIMLFSGNFAPKGWALCNGQLLPIAQNQALFAILGTTYGGNGTTNFALPDLRGRTPVGAGQGTGLSNILLGEKGGAETHILTISEMPAHNHTVNAVTSIGNQNSPTNNFLADTNILDKEYSNSASNTTMNPAMIASTGGSQAFSTRSPYLGMTYIIALQGIFPSQN